MNASPTPDSRVSIDNNGSAMAATPSPRRIAAASRTTLSVDVTGASGSAGSTGVCTVEETVKTHALPFQHFQFKAWWCRTRELR